MDNPMKDFEELAETIRSLPAKAEEFGNTNKEITKAILSGDLFDFTRALNKSARLARGLSDILLRYADKVNDMLGN